MGLESGAFYPSVTRNQFSCGLHLVLLTQCAKMRNPLIKHNPNTIQVCADTHACSLTLLPGVFFTVLCDKWTIPVFISLFLFHRSTFSVSLIFSTSCNLAFLQVKDWLTACKSAVLTTEGSARIALRTVEWWKKEGGGEDKKEERDK